jgi:acyl CoA:acetate/3-ketoacid CoA transferase alpha subunit
MKIRFGEVADRFFKQQDEGEDKVTTLEEAIQQNVRPGMMIHLGGDPSAALREIVRQFWMKNPRFILISGTITGPYAGALIYCGMVTRMIASAHISTYTSSTYRRSLQNSIGARHKVETENWSLYSIEQRLMAGALGLGFMPTKSIAGTDMAEENKESFKIIADPFNTSRKVAVVKDLVPDLSLVHGLVADRYGNTILSSPYGGAIWGPRASKNGVVVTVEKIVPTDFIREHPSFVRLPGYLVKSVCVAPLGAHPYGIVNSEIQRMEGYETDYDFIQDYAEAADACEGLDAWIHEWILSCPKQEDYLGKLGHERILLLRQKASKDAWEHQLACVSIEASADRGYSPIEMMIVAAAREIKEKVVRNGYRTILSGAGRSSLATWLAYYWLRDEGYGLDLLWGLGRIGYMPLPGQFEPVSVSHTLTCKGLTDTAEIYGVMVGGRTAKCLSVLGALQVDRFGNINNSRVDNLSIGAGGAADAINANESIVVIKQSPNRLVDRVPYVTCPGNRVKTLVSSRGIFEKLGDDKEFTLTACFSSLESTTVEERVKAAREHCGWELRIAEQLREVTRPTEEELILLRLLALDKCSTGD